MAPRSHPPPALAPPASDPPASDPRTPDPTLLSDGLRSAWQALVRAARAAEDLRPISPAQADLLRALHFSGGMTPADLAHQLHLARPTVSNLVKELVSEQLVERRPAPSDGRSVLVIPTERAAQVLAAFGRGRVDVLAQALAALSRSDRKALHAAAAPLQRLTAELYAIAERESTSGPA